MGDGTEMVGLRDPAAELAQRSGALVGLLPCLASIAHRFAASPDLAVVDVGTQSRDAGSRQEVVKLLSG